MFSSIYDRKFDVYYPKDSVETLNNTEKIFYKKVNLSEIWKPNTFYPGKKLHPAFQLVF